MTTSERIATSPRKIAMAAGVLYLLTFVSIPTLVLYGSIHDPNYIIGPGPGYCSLHRRHPRDHRGSRRHRHRRRAVSGAQEAERRGRAGLRRLADPGSRHDLRRRRLLPVGGDLAAGRSRCRCVGHPPRAGRLV